MAVLGPFVSMVVPRRNKKTGQFMKASKSTKKKKSTGRSRSKTDRRKPCGANCKCVRCHYSKKRVLLQTKAAKRRRAAYRKANK